MKRKPDDQDAQETELPEDEGGESSAAEPRETSSELAAAQKLARQLKNQVLELTADLDNQAQRFTRERQVVREEITMRFAREMIEVLDNLDSVVKSLTDAERASPLGQGVALTHVVFLEKLKSFGVEPIVAQGRPFDPSWHEAMVETPRDDVAPGTVLVEWTRGYRLGNKLVRAAKVEIAKAPAADGEGSQGDAAAGGN